MTAVIVYGGSIRCLQDVTDDATANWRIGLYTNEWEPQPNQGISAVVPATFSGYPGPFPLLGWGPPFIEGDQAVSAAAEIVWAHNGGPVAEWIIGVYVIDDTGQLVYADPAFIDDPVPMLSFGHFVRYVPLLTFKSSFAGR